MRNLVTGTMALGMLAAAGAADGAVIRTVETQADFASLSTTDGAGNLLVTGDLLTTATPDVVFPPNINDDLLTANPGEAVGFDSGNPGGGAPNGQVQIAGAGPYTYAFASAVNIAQIDVYTAWQDGRAGQNIDILVSSDGVNFTSLIAYNETSAGNEVVLSSITDDAGDLASNVTHIRFDPVDGTIDGDGGVYREIDVIGQPVPEPGSLALLGMGGLALIRRHRA